MAYKLPELDYAYDALEPHIDARTMEIHHSKHHQAYVNNVNAALEGTEHADKDIVELMQDLDAIPEAKRQTVVNNGGGHLNHTLFWKMIGPNGGGNPTGDLASAIDKDFGSFDAFKEQFETAAKGQFGSGWAWLVLDADGKLAVEGTANQVNPISHGRKPLLGIDVWEHAYYLKYQNKRPEYVSAFWSVVNWDYVTELYNEAKS